jgi:hypothetical protein
MEDQMKKSLCTLLVLSLALTGCVIDPGNRYGNRGWGSSNHAEFHAEHGNQGNWAR